MADKASALAAFLQEEAQEMFGKSLPEDMLHDFLYLIQREVLIMNDELAFKDNLVGTKDGPRCPALWTEKLSSDGLSAEGRGLVHRILVMYGKIARKAIRHITTNQLCWLEARRAMANEKNGAKPLKIDTMRLDALREKLRRKSCY